MASQNGRHGSKMKGKDEEELGLLQAADGAVDGEKNSNSEAEARQERPQRRMPKGILPHFVFSEAGDILKAGWKRPLEITELWYLPKKFNTVTASAELESGWEVEKEKEKPSLGKLLWRLHWRGFAMMTLLRVFGSAVFPLPAVGLIPRFVQFLQDESAPIWHGIVYLLIIVCCNLLARFCVTHSQIIFVSRSAKVEASVKAIIYDKTLKLAPQRGINTGNIVNLMSTDSSTIGMNFYVLTDIILPLLQTMAMLVVMWMQIGPYSLISVAILSLSFPLSALLGRKVKHLFTVRQEATDKRVKLVNELVQAIRIVKCYNWEKSFKENIYQARESELGAVRANLLVQRVLYFVTVVTPILVTAITLIIYASNQELTLSAALTTVAVIGLLRGVFQGMPLIVTAISQYLASVGRVQAFLTRDELPPLESSDMMTPGNIVELSGDFTWDRHASDAFTLNGIDLHVKKGEHVVIVGPVGSGKSSIILSTLGEMPPRDDKSHARLHGTVAYVPQQGWILNATIRENIVMGRAFIPHFYEQVLGATSLTTDLEMMPAGDQTEVGERGITLSGGQKQRLSIARALYADADLYLLDDHLSALDQRVSKHVYQQTEKGLLDKKTVIVVTNQLQYVHQADRILMMDNGTVIADGSYAKLMVAGTPFHKLMTQHGIVEEHAHHEPGAQKDQAEESKGGKKKSADGVLITRERAERGNVSFGVYIYYVLAGTLAWFGIAVASRMSAVGFNLTAVWWLSHWAAEGSTEEAQAMSHYVGWYLGITMTEALLLATFLVTLVQFGVTAGRELHKRCLNRIARAPSSFFDETPVGRVLARFSSDMDAVDTQMTQLIYTVMTAGSTVVGALLGMSMGAPWMLLAAIPLAGIYYWLQSYYRRTSIEIRRYESKSKAPVYSHFSETIAGVSSVRAYSMMGRFSDINKDKINTAVSMTYSSRYVNQWFNIRLALLSVAVQCTAYITIIVTKAIGNIDPKMAAIALSIAPTFSQALTELSINIAQLEARMNSVERIKEYDDLPKEAARVIPDRRPAADWPAEGAIRFRNYCLRYRAGDLILKNIDADIKPKEKIGIVGRTGAGKSTLLSGLFRLVEPTDGAIEIDGLDITSIGLSDLRSVLCIIPQDPLMFIGTIRYNLDPFGERTDDECWKSLEIVQLAKYVGELNGKLDAPVEEGGRNFSVGQRQLLCMARSLLRNSKILLLDEASSYADVATDAVIQKTVKEKFEDSTVLIIAHRLHTIITCDRIMVMDAGKLVEFDTPQKLLQNENGFFSKLVAATGPSTSAHLRKLAFQGHWKDTSTDALAGDNASATGTDLLNDSIIE